MKRTADWTSDFRVADYAKDQISWTRSFLWQVTLIILKQAIYDKSVQLGDFGDSNMEHSYKQDSHRNVGQLSFTHTHVCLSTFTDMFTVCYRCISVATSSEMSYWTWQYNRNILRCYDVLAYVCNSLRKV